jgi:xanthine dehydrogenase molybdenum-binding subunit
VPKVDAVEKATGAARFTVDIRLPNMLYGRLLRSPLPHARVLDIDASRALSLPGVRAVLTHRDVPRVLHAGQPQPRAGSCARDQYILEDTVRHVGDGVAAVAATSDEVAEEALAQIRVDYQPLPAVFDAEEAMQEGAPSIHGTERNLVMPPFLVAAGDIEAGFGQADFIFEDRYVTSRHAPAYMEPDVCICQFDAAGKLTVWISTQAPFMVRGSLSEVLGIPMSHIRVICEHMGGGFGAKQDLYQYAYLCALLAQRTGRPVKMEYTRAETFVAGRTRHPVIIELKQGVKRDGTLTARQARFIANSGAYASHGPGVTRVGSSALGSLHKCPNVHIEGICVYTNTPIAGAFRGYGAPQAYFALESQMDAIAAALGIDPIELRLRNAFTVGDRGPSGTPFTSCELAECLQRGAARIGWSQLRADRASFGPIRRGVGVACQLHSATSYPAVKEAAGAVISINEDGTAQLLVGSADLGTGAKTVLAQIAAEELGVRFEDIRVVSGDTDVTPYDIGAYASRTTFIAGGATQRAAAQAREQLLVLAADDLQAPASDLEIEAGVIRSKGDPQKACTLKALMASPGGRAPRTVIGRATFAPRNDYSFAAQFAEVAVDVETGQVRVTKMVAVHDIGKAINPATAEGQVEGALQQGIGYALLEDLLVDDETGRTRNANFVDYKMLTALDMPEIQVELLESADELGPFGAKGVAEDGTCPTAAAIANAIFDATGVRMKELPITPERLLAALGGAGPG